MTHRLVFKKGKQQLYAILREISKIFSHKGWKYRHEKAIPVKGAIINIS